MRIATWNVNGIRAALKKGLQAHLDELNIDILLLQEVRAFPEQLPVAFRSPANYHTTWHPADKPGYAGVATLSRSTHSVLTTGMHGPDPQGRVLVTRHGSLRCVNVYLPSGSRSEEAQAAKEVFMAKFYDWAQQWADAKEPVLIAGDLNIAHTKNDIHNPTGNKKNSGFLPTEREWFTKLLAQGWTDCLRQAVGEQKGPYSWWSNRGQARALDRGWRIDYLLANNALKDKFETAFIHRRGGLEISDHAPVIVDFSKIK